MQSPKHPTPRVSAPSNAFDPVSSKTSTAATASADRRRGGAGPARGAALVRARPCAVAVLRFSTAADLPGRLPARGEHAAAGGTASSSSTLFHLSAHLSRRPLPPTLS